MRLQPGLQPGGGSLEGLREDLARFAQALAQKRGVDVAALKSAGHERLEHAVSRHREQDHLLPARISGAVRQLAAEAAGGNVAGGQVLLEREVHELDHRRLHARLTQLTDTFFEEILFLAPIPRAHIAPTTAPLATRILHVAQLAAVNQALCRSLAALLDERAPWTCCGMP